MTEKTVFTDGVFDLFHANHLALLTKAATFGDKLVVAVISDAIARSYKRQPVIREQERLAIVRNISCVDHAFIFDDPLSSTTMQELIEKYRISAVVYAGDATPEFYGPAENAGIMHRLPYHLGTSTSGIIREIVSRTECGDL